MKDNKMNFPITKELNTALLAMLENNERISDYRIDLEKLSEYLTKKDVDNIINEINKISPIAGVFIKQIITR